MTRRDTYRITAAPGPHRRQRHRGGRWRALLAVARGLLAVLALFLTAADALGTALIGIPPVAWMWRRFAAIIRATYRAAARRPPPPAPVVIGRVVPPIERTHTDG
jgi:hypothetical protein